ncbi:MAG: excinuclease ABC subunit UvrA [Candidatus Brocadiia bacterium]|nr:excinuclease ABC subunit UvrA [Candidatus Brocadiia bacterium]
MIRARGVRVHNLKNIDVDIPRGRFVCVTGVSGSGKSSLVLDTLYAEGQRRYVESFSAYARQFLERMDEPDVDSIENIPPAIAIEQSNQVKNRRSTVGTATELNDYLRLLYARVGHVFCPDCDREMLAHSVTAAAGAVLGLAAGSRFMVNFIIQLTPKLSTDEQVERLREMGFVRLLVDGSVVDITGADVPELSAGGEVEVVVDRLVVGDRARERLAEAVETSYRLGRGRCIVRVIDGEALRFSQERRCAGCDRTFPEPVPQLFSFNSPLGACELCSGYGATIEVDLQRVVPDPRLSLAGGAIAPWRTATTEECLEQLLDGAEAAGIPTDVPWEELSKRQQRAVYEGTEHFYGVRDFFQWLESRKYKLHVRVLLSRYRRYASCSECGGTRLRPEARAVRVCGRSIAELCALTIEQAHRFFHEEVELTDYELSVCETVLNEIRSRLDYLVRIGLGYVTLDRLTRTLSGGEMQRVNLATSLGSALVNTLYILDEPSIGLHPRDNERLIGIIRSLRDRGNTVLVVEHDRDIIEAADHLIDIGPGAGELGGHLVYAGTLEGLAECEDSVTSAYLRGSISIALPERRRPPSDGMVLLKGCREHNLKGIDVGFPVGLFTCVTGVSGSGKSTLVQDTLYGAVKRHKPGGYGEEVGAYARITGHDLVDDAVLVDQSPIGRSPRSNPVTYIKAYSHVRQLFAGTKEARIRNLGAGAFSFNTPGGRCENCEGAGSLQVDMQFLADVYVTCDQCGGRRFRKDILDVKYHGMSIHDVLELTVEQAIRTFRREASIRNRLRPLYEVGLGYMKLGQPANTMSGGEAQRLKMAGYLAGGRKSDLLLIFDEPTVGLHLDDIRRLLSCINSLVEAGHTVVVVEHNLDLIKCADYVIDLGPEEGDRGGEVVVAGIPEDVAACPRSHTGRFLGRLLSAPEGR